MSDLLVYNGRVRTLEADQPMAEAVLVRDGKIAAIGSNDDLTPRAIGVKRLDAAGRSVVPGLIDSHVHYWWTGLHEQMVDLRKTRSIPEVLAAVRRRATELPAGTMLMCRGFMDTKMAENRYPTRAEMDEAAPNHIMGMRHNNGHSWAVNSRALAFLDIHRGTPGVELDPATGEPTGVLRDQISHQSAAKLIDLLGPEVFSRCIDIISRIAIKAGATTIHCLEGSSVAGDPDVAAILKRQADIPHNFVLWYRTLEVEKVLDMGLPRIGGCILLDGTPASHTGAIFEPFTDKPSTTGTLYWEQEELDEWVFKAHSAGLQIAVHATSERAIDQALNAYERAMTRAPRPDPRHRIEHFYFPRQQDIQRAARLGVGGGVQPAFETAFREMYPMRLGAERMHRVHPYRWHLDAGVKVGGGSDSQVTPVDPVAGIHAAVNHSVVGQRITPAEALRMFTVTNAWLGFEENEAGTLKVGKRGDITVLSDDPLGVDPAAIKDIKVGATIVRGRVVYEG